MLLQLRNITDWFMGQQRRYRAKQKAKNKQQRKSIGASYKRNEWEKNQSNSKGKWDKKNTEMETENQTAKGKYWQITNRTRGKHLQ